MTTCLCVFYTSDETSKCLYISSTPGRNYTDQCSIIKDNWTCTPALPHTPKQTHTRTHTCFLLAAISAHYCLKDKKQALSCGTHEAAYIFIISVPYSTSPLYACLLASLSSPQFPWCLACLQTSSVPLHCSGIVKICTGTSLVKLNNFSLSLSQSLHL